MKNFPTVLHAIEHYSESLPESTAIIEVETGRRCNFGELWAYIKAFSKQLAAAGVVRGSGDVHGTRVVVRSAQTIDFIVASLSVQLAGGVFVPIEKSTADTRIAEIMEETDSSIFITAKPLPGHSFTYISLADATVEKGAADDGEIGFPEPSALAEILFTTGTTGRSKGVMLSHEVITARIKTMYHRYDYSDTQTWIMPTPLSHANGLHKTLLSLYSACTVVLIDGYIMAGTFFSAVDEYGVTIINLFSAATEMYMRKYKDSLINVSSRIKYVSLSGSAYASAQIAALRSIFPRSRIIQAYGATEVTGCAIDHSKQEYASFCLGQPCRDTDIVFYDEKKERVIKATCDNPGLIAINNDTKMLGYWKNPGLTASVVRGSHIVLSDLGYMGDDGLYYFVSRADDVISSGAFKISPQEIEEAAGSFPGILECACIPINDPVLGQAPKLYVVMDDRCSFNRNAVFNHLFSKLEASKVPRVIEEIKAIPKVNNKTDRKELRNR